ncbi:putative signal peptide protein [Puccinia sorghi]|uniref:Putative signal peptide protein n=1 Tax=Puccinia sorghi TaxID=27349 RepID=A0A0L6VAH2_9BASI|nr:putative signal peptide protein [Puccinia sorghi]
MQTCGVWMAAWLEHAACQLQAVEQVFFAVLYMLFSLKVIQLSDKDKKGHGYHCEISIKILRLLDGGGLSVPFNKTERRLNSLRVSPTQDLVWVAKMHTTKSFKYMLLHIPQSILIAKQHNLTSLIVSQSACVFSSNTHTALASAQGGSMLVKKIQFQRRFLRGGLDQELESQDFGSGKENLEGLRLDQGVVVGCSLVQAFLIGTISKEKCQVMVSWNFQEWTCEKSQIGDHSCKIKTVIETKLVFQLSNTGRVSLRNTCQHPKRGVNDCICKPVVTSKKLQTMAFFMGLQRQRLKMCISHHSNLHTLPPFLGWWSLDKREELEGHRKNSNGIKKSPHVTCHQATELNQFSSLMSPLIRCLWSRWVVGQISKKSVGKVQKRKIITPTKNVGKKSKLTEIHCFAIRKRTFRMPVLEKNIIIKFKFDLQPPFVYCTLVPQPTQTSATTSSGFWIQRQWVALWCSIWVTMPKAHCTGGRYYMGKGYYKRRKVLHREGYIITRGGSYIQWIGCIITRGGRLSWIQWTRYSGGEYVCSKYGMVLLCVKALEEQKEGTIEVRGGRKEVWEERPRPRNPGFKIFSCIALCMEFLVAMQRLHSNISSRMQGFTAFIASYMECLGCTALLHRAWNVWVAMCGQHSNICKWLQGFCPWKNLDFGLGDMATDHLRMYPHLHRHQVRGAPPGLPFSSISRVVVVFPLIYKRNNSSSELVTTISSSRVVVVVVVVSTKKIQVIEGLQQHMSRQLIITKLASTSLFLV